MNWKKIFALNIILFTTSFLVLGCNNTNNSGKDDPDPTPDPGPEPIPLPTPGKPLNEYTWEEISTISKAGKAVEYFNLGDTKYVQLKHQGTIGAGTIDTIIKNEDSNPGDGIIDKDDSGGYSDGDEVYQTVRIIGFNHDSLASDQTGNTKAGITFQFVNVISDAAGHSVAGFWNDVADKNGSNFDYRNSTIRKLLNQTEPLNTDEIGWYQKEGSYNGYDGKTRSTQITNSVFNMLPNFLSNQIQDVTKEVAVTTGYWYNYTENAKFNNNLFLLSFREMTTDYTSDTPKDQYENSQKNEGTTYAYWSGLSEGTNWQTKQIRTTDYYGNGGISISDSKFTIAGKGYTYNYAGTCVNSSGATSLWMLSPCTKSYAAIFTIRDSGCFGDIGAYTSAFPVAPAFCI